MRYGTVVRYFPEKGFGFIRPDQGDDIFFHVSMIGACQEELQIEIGQAVKFELETREERERREQRMQGEPPRRDPAKRPQIRAKLVELIDRIPGGALDEDKPARHQRARRKKPTWRR